jgi:ribosome-associated translation inhibitor RaiA
MSLDASMSIDAPRAIDAEVTFRNMQPSEAVEERVRERLLWLARYASRVTSARVRIEAPHRNRAKGKIYHVRVALAVPGRPGMVVSHEPEVNRAHENVYIAIRDAFEAARRQLIENNTLRSHRSQPRDKQAAAFDSLER